MISRYFSGEAPTSRIISLPGAMNISVGKACTPASPVGPCMVSTEGSCAAYFKYMT